MSKEKNKNTFRVAALLLVACLISSVMLSGTFAKYTSKYAGQDKALVARWSLDIKEGDDHGFALAPDEAATLDLFGHTYSTNMLNADGHPIIAPGVDGEFVLNLTNNSDVAADIDFVITEEVGSADVPMEFSFNNFTSTIGDYSALQAALNDLNIHLAELGGSDTRTVYWRWKYDGTTGTTGATDESDTALGVASASGASRTEYTLNIKVIATQSVPANFTMAPIIVNTLTAGDTLTAGTLSGTPAGVSLQWQISDSVDGAYSVISGATGNTYVTQNPGDVNKYIRVVATGSGVPGESSGTVTSAPVGPITAP
jgi:hypothetical protein